MSKIIRRPDFASGGITEDERAKMAEHVTLWTARAFRTEPIDRDKITEAIHGLYAAAGLSRPRVVIVPSPLVMALAGGIAEVWWSADAATRAATYAATDAATYAATYAATGAATYAATDAATYAATDAATSAATSAATYAATRAATRAATSAATYDWFVSVAESFVGVRYDLACEAARSWTVPYQGGNMWAGLDCYLSAARDILGLRLPCYQKYHWWEQAAIHGGYRWMHSEFCLVCDFPERILIDDGNRPHCDDGPSHRWRDGWMLWHLHGVVVDEQIVMRPETQTIEQIKSEINAEVRRIRIERYGWPRYLSATNAEVLDYRRNDVDLTDESLMRSSDGTVLVCACPSTARVYAMRVPADVETCEQAQRWLAGDQQVNVILSS